MSMAAYKIFKNHLFVSSLYDEYGGVQGIYNHLFVSSLYDEYGGVQGI